MSASDPARRAADTPGSTTRLGKVKDPKQVLNYLHWRYRDLQQFFRNCDAYLTLKRDIRVPPVSRAHGLGEEIVISLTSHRPRFKTLHLTLECLARQSIRPDRIVVWIDAPDMPLISPRMRALQDRGVEYRETPRNLRSFNKIVHALAAFPDAVVVTVDDDMYYPPTLLEELLDGWSGDPKEIVCRYAMRITVDEAHEKRPFRNWSEVTGPRFPAYDMMPYGFAGVLYPPAALPAQTLDASLFKGLCPTADDVWLYWMARLNGCVHRKVAKDTDVREWPFSQWVGLKNRNMPVENQQQIDRMVAAFGWPSFEAA